MAKSVPAADRPELEVIGEANDYAGRAWLRTFPHGGAELLYKSGRGPSEVEQLNAWLSDCGSDTRIKSLRPGWSGGTPPKSEPPTAEENAVRVQRRARQAVRWNIKAIGADRMVTLTWRENMQDPAAAKAALAKFVARCRREWSGFQYCAAPELQARGAWHWHVALRGFVNVDKLRGFWWQATGARVVWSEGGKPVLRDGGETPGNVHIRGPGRAGRTRPGRPVWSTATLAGYIGKYVGKAVGDSGMTGAGYSASRGLTYTVRRFVVRADDLAGVTWAFFDLAVQAGLPAAKAWRSEAGDCWWLAGGGTSPPPGSRSPAPT